MLIIKNSSLFFIVGYSHMKGDEHRIWKEENGKMILEKIIVPKPNMIMLHCKLIKIIRCKSYNEVQGTKTLFIWQFHRA